MITPKSLLSFLSEAAQSEAAQQAKEMGLTSAGYGNWRDKSGSVVAKTVDGKLVMIDAKSDPMARPEAPEEEIPPEEEEEEAPQFVEPDPELVERIAKGLSGGRYDTATAKRKQDLRDIARQTIINKQIQDAQMQADAEAAAQTPPEPTPEELEQQQADMELQQQNAELDAELKKQSVENGKLDLQMKKDQIKQQKAADNEAKSMDKLAKKAQSQNDPGSMAQRMANDAEYEAQVEKDGEDALLDIQTEPNVTPSPKPKSKALDKTAKKAEKKQSEADEVPADLKRAGDDFLKSLLSGDEKKVDKSVAKAKKKKTFTQVRKQQQARERVDVPKDFKPLMDHLATNVDLEGPGTYYDKEFRSTGKGSPAYYPTTTLSGLDSPEDFPELPGRLSAITKLARKYIQQENDGEYLRRAQEMYNKQSDMAGSDYLTNKNTVDASKMDLSNPSNFIDFFKTLGDRNSAFGRQQNMWPDERQALIDNFPSEKSTSRESVLKKATINPDISEEDVNKLWSKVPSDIKKTFMNSGHGQGGYTNPYWGTPEGKEEWGKALMLRYFQQNGRDAYLNYEGAPAIHPSDMAADHIVSLGDKSWIEKAKKENPDAPSSEIKRIAAEMADHPDNIVMTRWGFNQGPKKSTELWGVREKQSKLLGDKGAAKAKESAIRHLTGNLRKEEYFTPLKNEITEIAKDITPEEYDMIRDMSSAGYSRLEKSGYERKHESGGKASLYERSALTDSFRILMDNVSLGNREGINVLANDRLRLQENKQKSAWQGIDGTHPNTGEHSMSAGYAHVDPALDYMKDRLAQSYYLGGKDGRLASRSVMRRIKRAGDAFVTGGLGSEQFVSYIGKNLKALEQNSPTKIDSPYNVEEFSKKYLRILNSTVKKLQHEKSQGGKAGYNFDGSDMDKNLKVPDRPVMADKIRNENLYEEFNQLNEDLKSIFTDEPWSEIYKDTVLEEFEYNGELI